MHNRRKSGFVGFEVFLGFESSKSCFAREDGNTSRFYMKKNNTTWETRREQNKHGRENRQ